MPADVLGPLHLEPRLVAKPWGGRRLARLGRDLPDDGHYGESWEVADLPDDATPVPDAGSRVASGPLVGATLAQLVATHRTQLLGPVAPTAGGRFPLLVKLLDAREHLSVQVHPPAAWVAEHPQHALKTESWLVVDALDGAELLLGLADEVTDTELADAIGTPAMVPLLRRVPARAGDVFHLPAGTIHALGAGCLVAEVQTPSDTTFRLYDWTDELGREPRELHLDEGLACVRLGWSDNTGPPQQPAGDGTLVDTDHYAIRRHRPDTDGPLALHAGLPRVLMAIAGAVDGDGFAQPLGPGGVVLLPAAHAGEVRATGGSVVLEAVPGTRQERAA